MATRREFMQRGGAIAAGLLAAPALGSLAACSSKSDSGPMSFWNFYGPGGGVPAQDRWFRTTVAQWNRRQRTDRDRIALRYVPNGDYISGSVLSTGFAAGNGPDVFLLSPGDFLRYYNGGALQDLTPHLAPGLREDYVPGALETRTVGDRVYGLPMELEPLAVYYDKRAFDRAGVSEPPATWNELLELGARLRTGNTFGMLFETVPGYYQNFTWYPFMWMGGGSPVNADSDGSSFDSASVKAALNLWGESVRRGIAPRSVLGSGGGDITANLGSGFTAMQQTGVWAIADHAAGAAKDVPIGVFKLPVPPGGQYTTALGGWAFVANARGKNPERAAEFCAWALGSTDAAGIERCRQWNTVVKTNLPPRRSVRALAERRGAFTGLFKTFADEIAVGARGEPRYPPQVYKAVSDAIQAVQLGGEPAAGAASRAADIIDSYLGGYRGADIA